MKKYLSTIIISAIPALASAQGATDLLNLSDTELRGTARYMSMAGAYTALGGDLSAIAVNPAAVGVYRSNDVGLTFGVNLLNSTSQTLHESRNTSNTAFGMNNLGGAISFPLNNSGALKSFNFGVTYTRLNDFNRRSTGRINEMPISYTNYVAEQSNYLGITADDINRLGDRPYDSNIPWMTILTYDALGINPDSEGKKFKGLMDEKSSAASSFSTFEEGYNDEYNISFGGNISNKVYWGVAVGISDIRYSMSTYYNEYITNANLENASYRGKDFEYQRGTADLTLYNRLYTRGTGVNFKAGVIVRPINEFRIGFSIQTPTYYTMRDEFFAETEFSYPENGVKDVARTNYGYYGLSRYNYRTPLRVTVGVAAILGGKATISAEYRYQNQQSMSVSYNGVQDAEVRQDVKDYYQGVSTLCIGGEVRVTKNLSLRLGYSYVSTPIRDEVFNNETTVYTQGTTIAYLLPNTTQYITAGLGYKFSNFYIDVAYVRKQRENSYHMFSPLDYAGVLSPSALVKNNNNQIVLTLGVRF